MYIQGIFSFVSDNIGTVITYIAGGMFILMLLGGGGGSKK